MRARRRKSAKFIKKSGAAKAAPLPRGDGNAVPRMMLGGAAAEDGDLASTGAVMRPLTNMSDAQSAGSRGSVKSRGSEGSRRSKNSRTPSRNSRSRKRTKSKNSRKKRGGSGDANAEAE